MGYVTSLRAAPEPHAMPKTENLNVGAFDLMPSPEEVKARLPLDERAAQRSVTCSRPRT